MGESSQEVPITVPSESTRERRRYVSARLIMSHDGRMICPIEAGLQLNEIGKLILRGLRYLGELYGDNQGDCLGGKSGGKKAF